MLCYCRTSIINVFFAKVNMHFVYFIKIVMNRLFSLLIAFFWMTSKAGNDLLIRLKHPYLLRLSSLSATSAKDLAGCKESLETMNNNNSPDSSELLAAP